MNLAVCGVGFLLALAAPLAGAQTRTAQVLLDEVTYTHPDSGVTIAGRNPVRFLLLTRSPDTRCSRARPPSLRFFLS